MAVKPSMDLIDALGKKGAPSATGDVSPAKADGPPPGLSEAMQELIDAIGSGDADAAAEAFEGAHRICESY